MPAVASPPAPSQALARRPRARPSLTLKLAGDRHVEVHVAGVTDQVATIEADGSESPVLAVGCIAQAKLSVTGLGKERAAINGLQAAASAAGVDIELQGQGAVVKDVAELDARLAIKPFSPRAALRTLGQPDPVTADAAVLQNFSATGDLKLQGDAVSLENLAAKLDDTSISGRLSLASIEQQRYVGLISLKL